MIGRVTTALWLVVVLLTQIVVAGITTAWFILRPGPLPTPGLLRMRFAGLSPTGAALLGALITLTPGTTTLEIDVARGELLLHLLDAADPARVAREIHARFELPLRRVFPQEVRS